MMGCGMSSSPQIQNSSQIRKGTKRVKLPHQHDSESDESTAPSLGSHSSSELAAIAAALSEHFLFASLSDEERFTLAQSFKRFEFSPGQTVFSQGQPGDGVYVVISGEFSVYVDSDFKRDLHSGDVFGDLALLYSVTRTATVKNSAASVSVAYRLAPDVFRRQLLVLGGRNQDRIMNFLASDDRFSLLSISDRRLLASVATLHDLHVNAPLVLDDWLFIIINGFLESNTTLTTTTSAATTTTSGTSFIYTRGDVIGGDTTLFGGSQPVEETLTAKSLSACLSLSNAALESRLTPGILRAVQFARVRTALKRNLQNYGLTHEQVRALAAAVDVVNVSAGQRLLGGVERLVVGVNVELQVDGSVVVAGVVVFTDKDVVVMSAGTVVMKEMSTVNKVLNCSSLADVGQMNVLKQNMERIFIFKQLSRYQQDQVVRNLTLRRFALGEEIVKQGDKDNQLYLIVNGNVEVSVDGHVVRTLAKWDYFGERALLFNEPRSASCKAVASTASTTVGGGSGVEVMMLKQEVFRQIVGNFKAVLERRIELQDDKIELKDLEVVSVVGEGAFGKVALVQKKDKKYALKQVNKAQAVKNKQMRMLVTERDVLLQCNHPCIVQCVKTFKDKLNIYFLTEFLGGGDLFTAMRIIGMLSKQQVRFYVGSILLAIEYLHQVGFIYKDLKPEQVMLDEQGYVKLVDMGCAKKAERTYTMIGTPDYMAPEVIKGQGYGKEVDVWALGVVMYELVCGPLPFEADDQLQLFKNILEAPVEFPSLVKDNQVVDLISGMLIRDPNLRIKDDEIKTHAYFDGFSFDALICRTIDAPWRPDVKALARNWTKPSKADVFSSAPYVGSPNDWDKDF